MPPTSINENINTKVEELLAGTDNNLEIGKEIARLWRENYKATYELAQKNSLTLATLALTFSLFATASIGTETSLFGMKFDSMDTPLIILYPTCSYLFYRVLSLFAFAQLAAEALRATETYMWKSWQEKGLVDLADFPSVLQIENTFHNVDSTGPLRLVAMWSARIILLFALVAALCWFCWGAYILVTRESITHVLSIPLVVVAVLFIVRALLAVTLAILRSH